MYREHMMNVYFRKTNFALEVNGFIKKITEDFSWFLQLKKVILCLVGSLDLVLCFKIH